MDAGKQIDTRARILEILHKNARPNGKIALSTLEQLLQPLGWLPENFGEVAACLKKLDGSSNEEIDCNMLMDWMGFPKEHDPAANVGALTVQVRVLEERIGKLQAQNLEGRLEALERNLEALAMQIPVSSANPLGPSSLATPNISKSHESSSQHTTPQKPLLFYPRGRDQPPVNHVPASYLDAMAELGVDLRRKDHEFLDQWIEISDNLMSRLRVDPTISKLLPSEWSSRLANSVKLNFQPYVNTLEELRTRAEEVLLPYSELVERIANATRGVALLAPLKGDVRCRSKATFKYSDSNGIAWYRLTDIVRATLLYDTIDEMYQALSVISETPDLEIVEFTDKYRSPQGVYRDLQLILRFQGMICELQLNTHLMAAVKEASGHRSFEVMRELKGAIQTGNAQEVDNTLAWGQQTLSENSGETLENIINDRDAGLLCKAAAAGQAEIVNTFLSFRGDPNLASRGEQWTPLHAAMKGCHERVVWALLSHCPAASFSSMDSDGNPPLLQGLLMLRSRPDDERAARVVSLLCQWAGIDHMKEVQARLPEELKKRYTNSSALVSNAFDGNMAEMLLHLNNFADPDSVDKDGMSAIFAAVKSGNVDAVKLLLSAGADPKTTTEIEKGNTIEVWRAALQLGKFSMITLFAEFSGESDLRKFGCTASECKQLGWSPLRCFLAGFSLKNCTDAGFTIQECSKSGFTPLDFKKIGHTALMCKDAGWSALPCKRAGYTREECEAAGLSMEEFDEVVTLGHPARALSMHYIATMLFDEMEAAGLNRTTCKVFELESTVIRPRGAAVVCPRDGKRGAAYVDCLEEAADNVGFANLLVSYTWGYVVADIADALENHCRTQKHNPKRTYAWLCIFCINQHRIREALQKGEHVEFETFLAGLVQRIVTIPNMIAIMTPWRRPVYLTRVWTFFELGVASIWKTNLTITMPSREVADLRKQAAEGMVTDAEIEGLFDDIAIENAQCSVPVDKDHILAFANSHPDGTAAINAFAKDRLRDWMRKSCECN